MGPSVAAIRNARLANIEALGSVLVTGAAGFLGRNLVKKLLAEGCKVRALIRATALNIRHDHLEIVTGDVTNPEDMVRACEGIETVFHTAADICLLGGVAASRSYRGRAWQINVEGSRNIIRACQSQGVQRLVYTSSVDVCFAGKPLPQMREELPYSQSPKSVYAQTKIEAESLVLAANSSGGLLTCAIRPDGIYGAEPNDMIDRFCEQLRGGKLIARIGRAAVLQDNSQIDNLVHGEVLAAMHLLPEGVACGQAYFIGDNEPMNSFEFFRPLIEGLGYQFPTTEIPAGLLRPIVVIWEALHFWIGLPRPMLSPHELDKVSVTHYASIDKAKTDLAYEPVKSYAKAMADCLAYCQRET
jgi:3beta-hydroxy-delta5-steroid dehydrogenase/steroid delta-isomerase